MYDEHFGLTGRPFQLTPDPAFWYETATHRRAMAYLGYGLAQGEGFIVITGDIGAGKTTLVGHLIDTLDREALNPIKLVSTAIEASDLLRIVAGQLGVDVLGAGAGLDKAALLTAIERGLHAVARSGRRTLLIVDEAQALPTGALEELRMLSNFQAGGHALLQIVLLGQPEFRSALHGSERLEQLRQRVIAIHHLEPMAAGEVAAYVRHRLGVVGWSGRPGFADSAFAALHRLTDGVPRRLNQLANRVMLHAAVEGVDTITAATVDHVAADLFADLPTMGNPAGGPPAAAIKPAAPVEVAAEPMIADETMVEEPAPAVMPAEVEPVVEPAPAVAILPPVEEPVVDEPVAEQPVAVEPVAEQPVAVEPAPEAGPVAETGPDRDFVVDEVVADAPASEPEPRPFRHSWLEAVTPAAPEPAAPEPAAPEPAAPEPVAIAAEPDPVVPAASGPEAPPPNPALAERFAELEARLEEQDAALRRVLTLLVDWVENDQTGRPASVSAPAPVPPPIDEPRGYVPIRGAAA